MNLSFDALADTAADTMLTALGVKFEVLVGETVVYTVLGLFDDSVSQIYDGEVPVNIDKPSVWLMKRDTGGERLRRNVHKLRRAFDGSNEVYTIIDEIRDNNSTVRYVLEQESG